MLVGKVEVRWDVTVSHGLSSETKQGQLVKVGAQYCDCAGLQMLRRSRF